MKKFSSEKQKLGELGELITCRYLLNKGFSIIERNYTKKWGEIDIVAIKDGVIRFFEVKSVTRENFALFGTKNDEHRPEDQMHPWKQKRLIRTICTYIAENEVGEWQFDVACVYVNQNKRIARVNIIENVILE